MREQYEKWTWWPSIDAHSSKEHTFDEYYPGQLFRDFFCLLEENSTHIHAQNVCQM